MKNRFTTLLFLALSTAIIVGCGKKQSNEVVVYTSVDQVFSEPILKDFEQQTGITVKPVFDTEETKSTGVLNRLIAETENPQCDVFWSGDPIRALVLKSKGITTGYLSPNAASLPDEFKDAKGEWIGFSARARVILYNTTLVKPEEAPASVYDFTNPKWNGRCAIANPLFGTTTFHVASIFSTLGDQKAKDLFRMMKENNVVIATSNGDVRKRVANGEVVFGLTDTDDAYEAIKEGKPVSMVFPDADGFGTLMIPNTLSLTQGSPNPDNGKRLIDYLLTREVEAKLAESCAQLPLLPNPLKTPAAFSVETMNPMKVSYEETARKMEEIQPFLKEWLR